MEPPLGVPWSLWEAWLSLQGELVRDRLAPAHLGRTLLGTGALFPTPPNCSPETNGTWSSRSCQPPRGK